MNKNYNEKLSAAVEELLKKPEKEKIPFTRNGVTKYYTQVQDRVEIFRKHFGCDAQIDTTQTYEPNIVRSETTISIGGERVANGIAEEKRDGSFVNKTSAAENAETSSIGRALANLSLHGGEYASAEELFIAVNEQKKGKTDDIAKDKKTINKNLNGEGSNEVPLPEIPVELSIVLENFNKARHLGELQKIAGVNKEYLGMIEKDQYQHALKIYNQNEERLTNGR